MFVLHVSMPGCQRIKNAALSSNMSLCNCLWVNHLLRFLTLLQKTRAVADEVLWVLLWCTEGLQRVQPELDDERQLLRANVRPLHLRREQQRILPQRWQREQPISLILVVPVSRGVTFPIAQLVALAVAQLVAVLLSRQLEPQPELEPLARGKLRIRGPKAAGARSGSCRGGAGER